MTINVNSSQAAYQQLVTDTSGDVSAKIDELAKGLSPEEAAKFHQIADAFMAQLAKLGDGIKLDEPEVNKNGSLEGLKGGLSSAQDGILTDIYAFMTLFTKMAQESRQSARIMREADLQSQINDLKEAAQKIRDAAQQRFVSAVVQGACQIGMGALQMGSAAASGYQMGKSISNSNNAADLKQGASSIKEAAKTDSSLKSEAANWTAASDKASANATKFSNSAEAYRMGGQGLGQLADGAGKIGAAYADKQAADEEAMRSELEASSKVHEAARDKDNELMQQMMDIIRDIRDKLAAIEQSNSETNRKIIS
ncbi:type III secretion system translocon subunit SctB [Parachitinimonas caeni]|uniref:Type III secretion system translocon subunit SctB n=1 Tax=Parachitinimonas caeni TaxID=3031301 RepID=A0ABT7DWF4_9NEIS|nr:type III secretion system translocon subunit SctB [Parachitinimonas caeni]MDK2123490.1 type III secretion system translocon subunit SctB [Parachitinimonas caeni]